MPARSSSIIPSWPTITFPISLFNRSTACLRSSRSVRCSNKFSSILCMFIKSFQLPVKLYEFIVRNIGLRRQVPHICHYFLQRLPLISSPVSEPPDEILIQGSHRQMIPGTDLVLEMHGHFPRQVAVIPTLKIKPADGPDEIERSISQGLDDRDQPL